MTNVVLTGWRPGFQKVSFTKLLQTMAGLTLGDTKRLTDQILEKNSVTISLPTHDRAVEIVDAADHLGAVADIISSKRTGTHG